MRRAHAMLLAVAALMAVAPALVACGGSSLPEAPACVSPTPTPRVDSASISLTLYHRIVADGERQLALLLEEFRARYPDRLFYRSESFRTDWVGYSAAATCVVDDLDALQLPPGASEDVVAREAELASILAEYRRVLELGSEAVRQRNTSDYRDFHRNIDAVAQRLSDWVDRGFD